MAGLGEGSHNGHRPAGAQEDGAPAGLPFTPAGTPARVAEAREFLATLDGRIQALLPPGPVDIHTAALVGLLIDCRDSAADLDAALSAYEAQDDDDPTPGGTW